MTEKNTDPRQYITPRRRWGFSFDGIKRPNPHDNIYHDKHEGMTEEQRLAELNNLPKPH